MIPIPVFRTKYTATMQGRVVKIVPCENCSTEDVYVLERESSGVGTSLYMTNEEGAENHAKMAAEDTLKSALENDFDPVPCPACGHYQRYMFPKLLLKQAQGAWLGALMLVLLLIGCLDAVAALCWSAAYLQNPHDHAFRKMVLAWLVLLPLSLIGLALAVVKQAKIRRFNPNLADQQARIAIARSRAITRAEFAKTQQGTGDEAGA